MLIKVCLFAMVFNFTDNVFSQDKKLVNNVKIKQIASTFTGDYESTNTASTIFINLLEKNSVLIGTLTMNGEIAKISGSIKDRFASGKIVEVDSKKVYNFYAQKSGTTLNFSIVIPEQNNQTANLILNKVDAQKLNKELASKSRDQKLIGTWRYTEVISSGSGQFYSSFSTDYFAKFNADGTVFVWTGKSAGGSQNATIDGNASAQVQRMQWFTTGKILYLVDPTTMEKSPVQYYAEANRIMLSNNKNKKVYQRIN
jgi:hypothetical protein